MAPSDHVLPIFLHGLWRCGSTYVWSRFRAHSGTYCYYEPLHHGLARLTHGRIGRDTPDRIDANAHPSLATPYFEEFRPLIAGRGVKDYRSEFGFERFVLGADSQHPSLKCYINGLIGYAHSIGKTPVFGFNRTPFRIAWLRHNYPSSNIYIDRDPRDIWASYQRHMQEGNNTFFVTWLKILECNETHPYFEKLCRRLPLRRGLTRYVRKHKSYYADILKRLPQEETYRMVFSLWLAGVLNGLSHCDVVIDMNNAGLEGYSDIMSEMVHTACGLQVDFSGMRPRPTGTLLFDAERVETEVLAEFPLRHMDLSRARTRRGVLQTRKADLLKSVL